MLLTIDIGNTRLKLGLFREDNLIKKEGIPLQSIDNVESCESLLSDFIGQFKEVQGVCVSSVVPDKTLLIITALSEIIKTSCIIVTSETKTGLDLSPLKNPQTLGADRIACAAWAFHTYRKPICIVDFGSATTISIIDGKGRFIGGAIIPGVDMMAKCLSNNTASLPLIELTEPINLPANNTLTAVVSGIIIGTAGGVERIISEIEREMGYKLFVVITGGNAVFAAPYLNIENVIEQDISLKGLRAIYELNRD